MFVSLFVTAAIGALAIFFGLRTQEEIVKLGAVGVAIICALLGLILAPFVLKLLLVSIPLLVKDQQLI